jgi:hypothetical protein
MTRARLLLVLLVPAMGCDALVGVHDLFIVESEDGAPGPADAMERTPGLVDTGLATDAPRGGRADGAALDSMDGEADATVSGPDASGDDAEDGGGDGGDGSDGESDAADGGERDGGLDGADAAVPLDAGPLPDDAVPEEDASAGGDDSG